MDPSPPPTNGYDADMLADLGDRAHGFIMAQLHRLRETIAGLGGRPLAARLARHLLRHVLAPAEAALRRALAILAAEILARLPTPAPRAAKALPKPKTKSPEPKAETPRPPVFRMSEPQPRPNSARLPEALLPRITLLTDAALAAPSLSPPPPAPADPAAIFTRRLEALENAMANPMGLAGRIARRWAARPRLAQKALSPHKIPGQPKSLHDEIKDLLRELTDVARAFLPADTS